MQRTRISKTRSFMKPDNRPSEMDNLTRSRKELLVLLLVTKSICHEANNSGGQIRKEVFYANVNEFKLTILNIGIRLSNPSRRTCVF
ncbi:MAG: hypothetical protein JXR82_09060 [Marinifilaceae bacterium]|nr:hypothetical protein [Marinifilaceae bacterium]